MANHSRTSCLTFQGLGIAGSSGYKSYLLQIWNASFIPHFCGWVWPPLGVAKHTLECHHNNPSFADLSTRRSRLCASVTASKAFQVFAYVADLPTKHSDTYQNTQGTDSVSYPNNATEGPYGRLLYVKIPVQKCCWSVQYSNRASPKEAKNVLNGSQL